MKALNEIPRNLRVVGVTMTLAALLIALVAVAMTTSPTMAKTGDPNPAPCGPGQDSVSSDPDAIISQGHYGVFEGYWDTKSETLNLNLCPPAVQHVDVRKTNPDTGATTTTEVSTRYESNVDIRNTVFHIEGSGFEHTLTVADLEEYDFLKVGDGPDADTVDDAASTTVWWLKVDDESTPEDEDSPLAMGFSAALFESQHWYRTEGGVEVEPLQYEFEVIREPGIPLNELGHVFAFDDSPAPTTGPERDIKTAYWDSSRVDANALPLNPGDYHHFQWVFTKPGTYEISVQLKGHVRKANPYAEDHKDYATWEAISEDAVVTSEVERYTFQIGPLTLNKEPAFVVERSVEEHSPDGTLVGAPIPVYQGDDDDLTFTLTGPGYSLFRAEEDSNGNAQIKVAGDIDHEDRSEYHLTLNVRDNKDHEGNTDGDVDNSILVKIGVTDVLLERSVAENLDGGVLVGDPIPVANADANTVYTVSGDGSEQFVVLRNAAHNAQLKVPAGTALNYEDAWSYDLTVHADTAGTDDVRVVVTVEDRDNERLAISLLGSVPPPTTQNTGTSVVLTGTVTGSPVPTSQLSYTWHREDVGGGNATTTVISSPSQTVTEDKAGERKYWMKVSYQGEGGVVTEATSEKITINWLGGER